MYVHIPANDVSTTRHSAGGCDEGKFQSTCKLHNLPISLDSRLQVSYFSLHCPCSLTYPMQTAVSRPVPVSIAHVVVSILHFTSTSSPGTSLHLVSLPRWPKSIKATSTFSALTRLPMRGFYGANQIILHVSCLFPVCMAFYRSFHSPTIQGNMHTE